MPIAFLSPRTPNSLCQKVLDSVWSWKTFPLQCCSWLAAALSGDEAKALAVFHAFAGCDTTSSFAGHWGQFRKSAWETWSSFPQVINASLKVYSHSALQCWNQVTKAKQMQRGLRGLLCLWPSITEWEMYITAQGPPSPKWPILCRVGH